MTCKNLSANASAAELEATHKAKMAAKKNRKHNIRPEYVLANLSRNHEHFGDTPREHQARKNNS